MIYIEELRFKNVASSGNVEVVVGFTDVKNYLFVGKNGSGKSTVLNALSFAKFGKPFTKIKISELVNDINNHLEVSLSFRTDKSSYKIVRGLKPDVFDIYENGELVPKPGNKDDYQKFLNKIFGYDYKIFKISILHGSATYTPFMQLDAKDRREFTEKLLDIEVITVMSDLIKKDLKLHKEKVKSKEDEIYKIEINLKSLSEVKIQEEEKRKRGIDEFLNKIKEKENSRSILKQKYDSELEVFNTVSVEKFLKTKSQLSQNIKELERKINETKTTNRINQRKIDSVNERDVCPECLQNISSEQKKILLGSNTIQSIEAEEKQLSKIELKYNKNEKLLERINIKEREIREIKSQIDGLDNEIRFYNNEIEKINYVGDYSNIEGFEKKLQTSKNELDKLKEEQKIKEMSILFLKDDGIKTEIISRYLPVINQSINKYLKDFGLFMRFELNSEFEEVFKSRHVKNRSYYSFSEGEKKRIDLSILFAFKEISQRKHKISCNFMAFDEIFEKMDDEGIESVIKILKNNDKVNIVITHEQELINSFNGSNDKIVLAEKQGNFTSYKFLN